MKNTISDKDKLAEKLEGDDKETIETAVKEARSRPSRFSLSAFRLPSAPLSCAPPLPLALRRPSDMKREADWTLCAPAPAASPEPRAQVLEWLDENQAAEKEDYEEKLKDIEGVCSPIISKAYAAAGGGASGDDAEEDHDEL